MEARLAKLTDVLSFTSRLLEKAEEYHTEYSEGSLSLYMHILLKMFVESRGRETLDTMGDTSALEQLAVQFVKLEPLHERLDNHDLEGSFMVEVIADIDKYFEKIKDVPPEVILYASFRKHYFGDDFLNYITDESNVLEEMAEEFGLSMRRMERIVQDFQVQNNDFSIYLWRGYRLESFIDSM